MLSAIVGPFQMDFFSLFDPSSAPSVLEVIFFLTVLDVIKEYVHFVSCFC